MSDDLKEKLREIICEVAELDEVPDDTPLADLGVDSMMALEIVSDVERTYKISIPEDELQDLTTLNAVYEKVLSKMD